MLSESSSLFYRPKDKKLHADQARQNFVRAGGDHFTLLNIWEQWADANFSQQFCYEHFLQYKSLSRARDIRDQLAGLCERVEVVVQSSSNPNDISPIQKAFTAGYFFNTVCSIEFRSLYVSRVANYGSRRSFREAGILIARSRQTIWFTSIRPRAYSNINHPSNPSCIMSSS